MALSPGGIKSHSRIVWYVTSQGPYAGGKSLRARSMLDEVVSGAANELYERFQRLGVYDWEHVVGLVNGSPYGKVMALRFSNTVRMDPPVSKSDYDSIRDDHGSGGTMLQAPQRIEPEVFQDIVKKAERDE